jgi:hypothetical protein
MKSSVLLLLLALVACDGKVNVTNNTKESGLNIHVNMNSDTKITCDSSPTGNCFFVFFTEACDSSSGKSVTCKYDELERFSLAQGESRVFDNLPAHYRRCNAVKPQMTVPDCLHPN